MSDKAQYHTAGRLLRGMESTHRAYHAVPLTVASISGLKKSMINVASRNFRQNRVPDTFFLSHVTTNFPSPEQQYCRHVNLIPESILLVTLMIHGTRLLLQQWKNVYKKKTGTTGWNSDRTRNDALTCRTSPSPSYITSSSVLLHRTGDDTTT